jgi:hypothetical protein
MTIKSLNLEPIEIPLNKSGYESVLNNIATKKLGSILHVRDSHNKNVRLLLKECSELLFIKASAVQFHPQ